MAIHTDFRKGEKVRVILKQNRPHIVGRFQQHKDGVLHIDDHKIAVSTIRLVMIERAHSDKKVPA